LALLAGTPRRRHDEYILPTYYAKKSYLLDPNTKALIGDVALFHVFERFLNYWIAFPTLINDFFMESLKKQKSPKLEKILLNAWFKLPETINELFLILIRSSHDFFISRKIFGEPDCDT